jgi:hypothetical protein
MAVQDRAASSVNVTGTYRKIDTPLTQPVSLSVPKSVRIQRKRSKGWKMPADTVCVCRPGPFGNPFTAKAAEEAGYCNGPEMAVVGFIKWLAGDQDFKRAEIDPGRDFILNNVSLLRGKNLACWCPLDKPCHANVLLEMANPFPAPPVQHD